MGYFPQANHTKSLFMDLNASKGWAANATDGTGNERPIHVARQYGYTTQILPFIEATTAYDTLYAGIKKAYDDATSKDGPAVPDNFRPWSSGTTSVSVTVDIPSFTCPSDSLRKTASGSKRISYRGCRGDHWCNWDSNVAERGIFAKGTTIIVDMGGIPDGTSNTILLSEGVIGPTTATDLAKGGQVMGLTSKKPSECLGKLNSDRTIADAATSSTAWGQRWMHGRHNWTIFMTVLPPNSVSCSSNATGGNVEENNVANAASYHSGGVNAALADGSVRFITDTIDVGGTGFTTALDNNSSSTSPYGVWGALGTRNCGESKGL